MDGTPPWRQFFRITLPYISPVVFFCIVYASIGALQVYESIVILTKGGPGDATRSLSILIVEEGFGSFQIGYAAVDLGGDDGDHPHHHRHPAAPVAPVGAAVSAMTLQTRGDEAHGSTARSSR